MEIANALWVQGGFDILPAYTDLCKRHYDAEVRGVRFDREAARQAIDGWVNDRTHGKIPKIMPDGDLRSTKLVLTNAVYFLGQWQKTFAEGETKPMPFRPPTGKGIQVPTMRQEEWFLYAETNGLSLLEMPYRGGRRSMLILLPEEGRELETARDALSSMDLPKRTKDMWHTNVEVFLPKFTTSLSLELRPTLFAAGMRAAFGEGAKFSGISDLRPLFISFVSHKAYVDVSEKGTEAAAATAVGFLDNGPKNKRVFRADHPFVFVILDARMGLILFAGQITDPK
jgi:serpin B